MEPQRFSEYTHLLTSKLPSWFKMKTDPTKSVGGQFLNIIGSTLEEFFDWMNHAYEQVYLETMDTTLICETYRAVLPVHRDASSITEVYLGKQPLRIVYDLATFQAKGYQTNAYQTLYEEDVCLIDPKKNIIYTKRTADVFDDCKEGRLSYVIEGKTYVCSLEYHQVWTFFDEIGLLFDCPRFPKETLEDYKRRLEDIFKHQRGAHKDGLINGIASDLGLRQRILWEHPKEPLILPHAMIAINTIELNGEPIPASSIQSLSDGRLILPPLSFVDPNQVYEVTYVSGLVLHQLHNKRDQKLQSELLKVDNTATNLLNYYIERIHAQASIAWGHFKWGEAAWDLSDQTQSGTAFAPNIWDANLSGFLSYNPN